MKLVEPGDIIFSYANGMISFIGTAISFASLSHRPMTHNTDSDWAKDGWRINVNFVSLKSPISIKKDAGLISQYLPKTNSPLKKNLDGHQGYLFKIDENIADHLFSLTQLKVPSDSSLKAEIKDSNRYITVTDVIRKVKTRVGQSTFKKNLLQIETSCRVTGTQDSRFLIASHIKPWSACDSNERLDGNNGLLLAPHVDKLFDQGYISFSPNGDLLYSSDLPNSLKTSWNIKLTKASTPFNSMQKSYLRYHYQKIFKE